MGHLKKYKEGNTILQATTISYYYYTVYRRFVVQSCQHFTSYTGVSKWVWGVRITCGTCTRYNQFISHYFYTIRNTTRKKYITPLIYSFKLVSIILNNNVVYKNVPVIIIFCHTVKIKYLLNHIYLIFLNYKFCSCFLWNNIFVNAIRFTIFTVLDRIQAK